MKTTIKILAILTVISWPILIGFLIWGDFWLWLRVSVTDLIWSVVIISIALYLWRKANPELVAMEDEKHNKKSFDEKLKEAAIKKGYTPEN